MSKNIMKKFISGVLAVTSLAACVVTATSCETNKPEVSITISFNGETYEVNYELDRRVAPRTVKHFLYLAENGYYDGLCVHNYDEANELMYTGGYSYADGDLVRKDYYTEVANYTNFPTSVWEEKHGDKALYTLAGEFSDNHFKVTSGELRQTYGSLTMFYNDRTSDSRVCIEYLGERDKDEDDKAWRDYKYNSATSLFYISLSNSSTKNSDYCTFAQMKDSSKETLESFEEALEEYVEENYDSESDANNTFTKTKSMSVNDDDPFEKNKKNVTYYVPQSPIVIESVKVKKY